MMSVKEKQAYKQCIQWVWAFAVIWLSLGSLINFHQHHIWRKHLIPQVVASVNKKDKSKVGGIFKQTQENGKDKGIDQLATPGDNTGTSSYFPPAGLLIPLRDLSDVLRKDLTLTKDLRAPPAI